MAAETKAAAKGLKNGGNAPTQSPLRPHRPRSYRTTEVQASHGWQPLSTEPYRGKGQKQIDKPSPAIKLIPSKEKRIGYTGFPGGKQT